MPGHGKMRLKTEGDYGTAIYEDSYVIFITAGDVMGAGCSLYHVRRMTEETGTCFGDGSYIIYANAAMRKTMIMCKQIKTFGFPGTYNLLSYPNFL